MHGLWPGRECLRRLSAMWRFAGEARSTSCLVIFINGCKFGRRRADSQASRLPRPGLRLFGRAPYIYVGKSEDSVRTVRN